MNSNLSNKIHQIFLLCDVSYQIELNIKLASTQGNLSIIALQYIILHIVHYSLFTTQEFILVLKRFLAIPEKCGTVLAYVYML